MPLVHFLLLKSLMCPSSEYSTPSLSARIDSSHSKAYSEDTQKAAQHKESIRIRCSTVPSRVVNLATRDLYFCRACQLIADLILNQCVSQPPVGAVATLPENHHPSVERRLYRVARNCEGHCGPDHERGVQAHVRGGEYSAFYSTSWRSNPALSTATDYITQTLTNIAKTMSVSMSNRGGCATTTATTNDGGG